MTLLSTPEAFFRGMRKWKSLKRSSAEWHLQQKISQQTVLIRCFSWNPHVLKMLIVFITHKGDHKKNLLRLWKISLTITFAWSLEGKFIDSCINLCLRIKMVRDGPILKFCRYADIGLYRYCRYCQFWKAETFCLPIPILLILKNVPVFPIPIPVSAHP